MRSPTRLNLLMMIRMYLIFFYTYTLVYILYMIYIVYGNSNVYLSYNSFTRPQILSTSNRVYSLKKRISLRA